MYSLKSKMHRQSWSAKYWSSLKALTTNIWVSWLWTRFQSCSLRTPSWNNKLKPNYFQNTIGSEILRLLLHIHKINIIHHTSYHILYIECLSALELSVSSRLSGSLLSSPGRRDPSSRLERRASNSHSHWVLSLFIFSSQLAFAVADSAFQSKKLILYLKSSLLTSSTSIEALP